ncbi:RNA polymerase sigma factor [Amycolatopsis mediterranei S699]|uniref:RNA polymerase sigma factor n=2 Tax=Amycolatopsis mediterranei TaxID=33910 RepID=A0A0H3D6V3_AMYMU|nr:RNA polymerase sigma factor [Amycolatopsis mediterranei U32]AEK41994.1 RNA polymerase sigma factor [Amycolatopsis mediterranei S699]AGT84073.1 RNA polymerase sigma factor [Amycolatopsis mediterranei RB]KDO08519.1 RNA polymerase sigma factor [Amycolatopsis mediterranei]AFO76945.1 RNA polymerase sigma factor [Amycolatopsis mediterranei S699]
MVTEVAPAVAETTDVPSDAALIAAVRDGDIAAYGELYDRHLPAARRVAAAIAADRAERDDLIAEGFTRVLRILRSGEGPDEDFRPYLLTTIRNTMISWRRRDSAVSLVAEVPDVLPGAGSDEPVGSRLHATVAADAFASLPERWRTVLWRTEIDGESPARIAEDLGMTPNGVAALAYRAREGLRQAYLDQHVPEARRRNCKNVSGQLARWVRDGISDHKAHRIAAHLDRCPDCRELADGLRQLNQELPATVAPLILGIPIVSQWLSTTGSLATSGAAASATGTGASALSWATAAKVAVAGAALVTTVTIGASTSSDAPPPQSGGEGTTTQPVRTGPQAGSRAGVPPGGVAPTSDAAGSAVPTTPGVAPTGAQPAGESSGVAVSGQPAAAGNGTANNGTANGNGNNGNGNNGNGLGNDPAAKESKQAAKESSKAAKESAKESKKAEKTKNPGE